MQKNKEDCNTRLYNGHVTYTCYQTPLHTKFHKKLLNHGSGNQFDPRPVNVTFVLDKVALGQVFLPVRLFNPITNIPPESYPHSLVYIMLAIDMYIWI